MDHSYRAEIDGVVLRPLDHDDIEMLRVWRNDPENSLYIRKLDYISPENQEAWFESYLADECNLTFAIDFAGQLVGSVSLYDIEAASATFGHLMIGRQKGCGLGKKASQAALAIAFERMRLVEVKAEVSIDNTAAIVIYTELGFQVIGRGYSELARMDEFKIALNSDRYFALRDCMHRTDG